MGTLAIEMRRLLIPVSSKSVVIVAGSSFSLPVSVYRTNCVIQWEFQSIKYDVLFGILKVDEMGGEWVLRPNSTSFAVLSRRSTLWKVGHRRTRQVCVVVGQYTLMAP